MHELAQKTHTSLATDCLDPWTACVAVPVMTGLDIWLKDPMKKPNTAPMAAATHNTKITTKKKIYT